MADIGKRIKYLRKTKDMSQKELAKSLHVAVSTISNWERGRNNVSSDFINDIAVALDVKVSDLLDQEEKTNNPSFPVAMSSKPYLDYEYSFNYLYWGLLLVTVILTFISPIFKGRIQDLSILSWIIFALLSLGSLIKNYKKNISTKYYEDGQTLYYEHKYYSKEDIQDKKFLRNTVLMLFLIANSVFIFSAAIILSYTDDLFTYIFYPALFVIMNLLLVYSFVIHTSELHKGKTISYQSINLNFFLGRVKIMLILYIFTYFYHYAIIYTLDIMPYKGFAEIVFHIFFAFGIMMFVSMYQEEKYYYSFMKIKVK
ncbi:helix-turn-helix domain-containing protein [Mycoplasmatota bacterium]|nr:helix-turn-helix domain-containing protein [Mycoplasmatota bacterium]